MPRPRHLTCSREGCGHTGAATRIVNGHRQRQFYALGDERWLCWGCVHTALPRMRKQLKAAKR